MLIIQKYSQLLRRRRTSTGEKNTRENSTREKSTREKNIKGEEHKGEEHQGRRAQGRRTSREIVFAVLYGAEQNIMWTWTDMEGDGA